jgi:hypothetical protein
VLERGDVTQLLNESQFVRYAAESVVFVEAGGVFVDCVDNDEASGNHSRRCQHALECLGEQSIAESLPVVRAFKRKAGK